LLPDEDPDDDWPSRVLALIANRLTRPGSAHALGAWLESDYVCDRGGRRDVPCWKRPGRVERVLAQVRDFGPKSEDFGASIERKSFGGGAGIGRRRCSEDRPLRLS
jgi:hypothetical protein